VLGCIVLCHHEKWNGSGYPRQLVGEAIPLFARVVAVADVFDALSSKRAYKEAWTREQIFALFRRESGQYFDLELASIFSSIKSKRNAFARVGPSDAPRYTRAMKMNPAAVLAATTVMCACCFLGGCQSDPIVDGTFNDADGSGPRINRLDTPDGAAGDPAAINPEGFEDDDQDPNIG
jgi:hypothetical protein